MPKKRTRPTVPSVTQQHTRLLSDPTVHRSLYHTSISLKALAEGDPSTIYLFLPPEKLSSHALHLRPWMRALTNLLLRRRFRSSASRHIK